MSTTPVTHLTCNEINSQKSEGTKSSVCRKCRTWMDDKHMTRYIGKEQSGANKKRYGCDKMKPMAPLLEGMDEIEQIHPPNQSNTHETTNYVPINLYNHMESATTDVEILTNRGRNKIVSDINTVKKQKEQNFETSSGKLRTTCV